MISGLTLPLATALTSLGFLIADPGYDTLEGPHKPDWFDSAVVAFFALSLVANAFLTGLIVYKIVSVYRNIDETHAYRNGQHDLYPLISILVESGMITFAAQLVQIVMYKVDPDAFPIILDLVVMLYVRSSCRFVDWCF